MNLKKYLFLSAFLVSSISLFGMEQVPAKQQRTETEQKELNRQLLVAAEGGELQEVERLIEEGADVSSFVQEYYDGAFTPLHIAAFQGHLDVVKSLVIGGADVNAANQNGETPFFLAFPTDLEVARFLFEHGAVVSKHTLGEKLDLLRCSPQAIQFALEIGADANAFLENRGHTALYAAIFQHKVKVVELLLKYGAQVNAKPTKSKDCEFSEWTHLREACAQYMLVKKSKKSEEIIKKLIKSGAKIDTTDSHVVDAIKEIFKDKPAIVALLIETTIKEYVDCEQQHIDEELVAYALGQKNMEAVLFIAGIKDSYMRLVMGQIGRILAAPFLSYDEHKWYESLVLSIANINYTYYQQIINETNTFLKACSNLSDYERKSYTYISEQLIRRLSLVDQILFRPETQKVLLKNIDDVPTECAVKIAPTHALCNAVRDGDLEAASLALKYKADPNIKVRIEGGSKMPLLILAATHKDREIGKQLVELLLSYGALPSNEILFKILVLKNTEGMQDIIDVVLGHVEKILK
jgi:ankyrin repeat protein